MNRKPPEEDVEAIISELKEGLGEIKISMKYTDEMELTSTGKFRVVISCVD